MPRLTTDRPRSSYLGASDIAVVAGVSPYKKPFELYLEKIGELDPQARASQDQLDRFERGHRLEDVALDWHAEIAGIAIERVRRDVIHPRLPFVIVHPDARVKPWSKTRRLLEAKTSSRRWDEIPQHVEAQVQVQMAATGADFADVVVLGFDGPPTAIEVVRNQELIDGLEDLARSFWDRVERRDPPPIDGSQATQRWLDRMFREGPEERADDSQAQALARLLWIREEVKRLEAEDSNLVAALKFSMAGASRLFAPGVGRVLWTAPTTRSNVAWKEVAAAYRQLIDQVFAEAERGDLATVPFHQPDSYQAVTADDIAAIEGLYTTVAENVRTFRPTPAKPTEEVAAA